MTGDDRRDLQPFAYQKAQEMGIDPRAAYALFETENNWQNGASTDGLGYGMGQISYSLAQERGWNIENDEENIIDSLTYFKEKLDANGGDYEAAYGAYNGGDDSSNWNHDNIRRFLNNYYNAPVSGVDTGTDTSYAYPSDELNLDLSRPLPQQEGIFDTNLSHTDKVVLQHATALNGWVFSNFGKDITVSGGWRDESYNAQVGGVPNSLHTRGYALDFDVSNCSEEERELIEDKARSLGFDEVLYHDAGTGMHLHIGMSDPTQFKYMPQAGDYLPDLAENTDWLSIGAQSNPWLLNEQELLGAYNLDTSDFWKSVEEPPMLEALAHGFKGGNNWLYNFGNALYADLFQSEHSLETWTPTKEELDNAAQQLYGDRKEAERIASISRDETQFAYYLKQRQDWLDEERKYREYYSGIGMHTLGALGAAALDPLNFVGAGGAANVAKAATKVAAAKIASNLGGAVRNVETIDRVAKIAAALAENKKVTSAMNAAKALTQPHTGAVGVLQTTGRNVASGALQNIAQDYIVSKAQHQDTHMVDAALMGGIAGGALHLLGRTGKAVMNRSYERATRATRISAERVENGAVREAAGLKNQYKVQMEGIIEDIGKRADTTYFGKFSKTITNITDNNRVFALSRKDAEAIAGDSGFQLPKEARAWHEPSINTTFIIKDAIKNEDDLLRTLQHEIGVHQNLKVTMGEDNYNRLMTQITDGMKDPKSVWAQAAKHVDSFDPEEVLGYAVEHGMLNNHEARSIFKGIKQGLSKMGLGKRESMTNKEIMDFVSDSLLNARAAKHGVSLHENPDGSVVLNGVKFSKENMGNPNRLLDTLEMEQAGIPDRPKGGLKNKILDVMDGKGVIGRITTTNFGWLYHNPVPWLKKFAAEIYEDEQGRGGARMSRQNADGVLTTIPTVESMTNYFNKQLQPIIYQIGDMRNQWVRDTYGRGSVMNPWHADSRRVPFNDAAIARFNMDYRGIQPKHVPKDLLENEYVKEAAKAIKGYRDKMLELGKESAKMFGLPDEDGVNMVEKAWEAIDEEFFRMVDEDGIARLKTHVGYTGDKGLRDTLTEYARKFADRALSAKAMVRNQTLENARALPEAEEKLAKSLKALLDGHERYSQYLDKDNGVIDRYLDQLRKWGEEEVDIYNRLKNSLGMGTDADNILRSKLEARYEKIVTMKQRKLEALQKKIQSTQFTVERGKSIQADRLRDWQEKMQTVKDLKSPVPEPSKADVEQWIENHIPGFVDRCLGEHGEKAFDSVSTEQVGDLNYFRQRLPMDTSGEMKMPDGYVFSFDKDLRNVDLDYIVRRNARRFAGETAFKNFLTNQGLSLKEFVDKGHEQIQALAGQTISKGRAKKIESDFDDMIRSLRGMSSKQDTYGQIGAIAKIFKNLAYFRNGAMMGVNQLEDLATGIAHSGFGMVSSMTRTTMNKMMDAKYGSDNWLEIQNLSMQLEGAQVAGELFKTGFRDAITRENISSAASRSGRFLSDVADFTGNMTNLTTYISGLGRLTDNQVRYAQAQAIADAAQWAWGRKFSALRNPFSKNKLKELGVSQEKIKAMRNDIKEYLGWKGTKDSDFSGSRLDEWKQNSPETFWLFRHLIHNQVSRSIMLDSVGNANRLTQNSMIASALLMFKGFSFRANNARFARAIRTGDLDDALAFAYSMMVSSSMYAARQMAKVGALYAVGQTKEAQYIKDNYLNEGALARAALTRTAFLSPASLANDTYEALTGAPTIRTTVSNRNRTQSPQDAGDLAGNWIAQTPVVSTFDDMVIQPFRAAMALADGRGSKSDALKLVHTLPIPNFMGLTQAVDTLAKTTIASDLPDRRRPQNPNRGVFESAKNIWNSVFN